MSLYKFHTPGFRIWSSQDKRTLEYSNNRWATENLTEIAMSPPEETRSVRGEPSHWLSDDPEYQRILQRVALLDPRLGYRDPQMEKRGIKWAPLTNVAIFEAQSASHSFIEPSIISDPVAFRESLDRQTDPDGRRIIIIEGQCPAYIGAVGIRLKIHPTFFVDHERDTNPEALQYEEEYDGITLPSVMKEHVSMKYYELIFLPEKARQFGVFCTETGRYISATRVLGKFAEAGILHRKCSVWRRRRSEGSG